MQPTHTTHTTRTADRIRVTIDRPMVREYWGYDGDWDDIEYPGEMAFLVDPTTEDIREVEVEGGDELPTPTDGTLEWAVTIAREAIGCEECGYFPAMCTCVRAVEVAA